MRSKVFSLLSMSSAAVLFAFFTLSATGCELHAADEPTDLDLVAEQQPPAEQVETPPPAPSAAHFWIKGHWRWDGRAWRWKAGRWEGRREGYQYVPGYWERTQRGYVYVGAHWRQG